MKGFLVAAAGLEFGGSAVVVGLRQRGDIDVDDRMGLAMQGAGDERIGALPW